RLSKLVADVHLHGRGCGLFVHVGIGRALPSEHVVPERWVVQVAGVLLHPLMPAVVMATTPPFVGKVHGVDCDALLARGQRSVGPVRPLVSLHRWVREIEWSQSRGAE